MNKLLSNNYLLLMSRLILGGLFIYASIDKIINPLQFAQIIHNYRFLPPEFINIWAIILPWIEFAAGIFLVFNLFPKPSSQIIIAMLIVFIIALSVTAVRGINVACGCFSTSSQVKSNLVIRIIEDFGMLILGLHILRFSRTEKIKAG